MTAQALVARAKNLPSASPAATRLINLLSNPSVSNEELVGVIKCDNILTAKLLRACNSPSYALLESVLSVDQAVLILGHREIRHLVLTLGFGKTMAAQLTSYCVEANELWRHSLISASAAELVAVHSDLPLDPAVAFTAGLLHDIGKVVLNQTMTPHSQANIRLRVEQQGLSRVEAERAVLEVDHAALGAALLESWNLPEEIVESVRNHHEPMISPRPQLSVVSHAANFLAHLVGSAPGWDGFASRVYQPALKVLGLTPERLDGLVIEVRESFEQIEELVTLS